MGCSGTVSASRHPGVPLLTDPTEKTPPPAGDQGTQEGQQAGREVRLQGAPERARSNSFLCSSGLCQPALDPVLLLLTDPPTPHQMPQQPGSLGLPDADGLTDALGLEAGVAPGLGPRG